MKKIQVLMSTYNGELYLEEQLTSILNQNYTNFCILIRDDGSTDNTINIIKRFQSKTSLISLICGENIGVVSSFFELIKNADMKCDYFAFADQDDYWVENKFSTAVDKMNKIKATNPLIYFSKLKLVDKELNFIRFERLPSYFGVNNAIVQNIASGCSLLFNREMLKLCVTKIPNTDNIVMHDWWFYLLASCFGEIIYDKESTTLYRQHNSNSLGMPKNYFEKKLRVINYLMDKKGRFKRKKQNEEFYKLFHDLLPSDIRLLFDSFMSVEEGFVSRVKLAINCPFKLQSNKSTQFFRFLIILGLY